MPSDSPIIVNSAEDKPADLSLLARVSRGQWVGIATAAVALGSSVVSCQLKQAELKGKLLELQSKQVEIERLKHQQVAENQERVEKARREYLLALNNSDVVAQARILRFIVATESDEKLRSWADQELVRVQQTLAADTAANQQRVLDLTENIEKGKNTEEAKLEIAVRSSELARLSMVKSETTAPNPVPSTSAPPASASAKAVTTLAATATKIAVKKAAGTTAPECVGMCAQPARRCEAACAGDRTCISTKCYPEEAKCRNQCQSGKLGS